MALQANSSDFIGLRTDVPCKAFRRVCVRFFYTALVEDTRCRIGAIPSAHGFRSVFMRRRFARGIMRHASDECDYRQVRRENSWLYGCIAVISSPDVHSAAETKTSRRYPYSLNYTIFLCVKLLPLSALWLYPVSIFYIRGTYYSSWTPVVTIRVHFFVSGCLRLFMRE